MIVIDNPNKDPYLNHAIEEHILLNMDEDCFMLWQNEPCVLIGRNQNVYAEINMDYIRDNNIKIVRRITGGGTVFNDYGNFNFTFIAKKDNNKSCNFQAFTRLIESALKSLGVDTEFSGRNDLLIEGKKFSGNAQCVLKNKVLHHGTLLFETDINALSLSLNVSNLKLQSKNIVSTKSRVTNISNYLKTPLTLCQFRTTLIEYALTNLANAKRYELTANDFAMAEKIADNKYRQDSWNFPEKIDFTLQREKRFGGGTMQFLARIEKGKIMEAKIYGDFFCERNKEDIEAALIGQVYSLQSVKDILQSFEIDKYFGSISTEEVLSLLI